MDVHFSNLYAKFYNHTMEEFSNTLQYVIATNAFEINTIPMNNGGKNNLLYKIVDQNKLFNCYAYIFSEKGTWENKHRILRRIFYKGESLGSYINYDLIIANKFVNNYYSKMFDRI